MNSLPRNFSGVTVRAKTDAEALFEAIERFAVGGQIALWCVVDLLPLLKPHHWSAYARDAGIHDPSPETIAQASRLYSEKVGYHGLNAAPVHSQTSSTEPAIKNARSI